LRILITNNTLDQRAGSELYVRDLAIGLLNRGHTPIAYSTQLGDVAREIRSATVPVIDDLDSLGVPPDIIHGQHHLETMTALVRFPGVPAVSFCHGWLPWEETPPRFPRILQYVAVDHACRDRLILESGIPADRVRVLLNFVDLERFKPRKPLPARPQRALIISNHANEYTHTSAVRQACARRGITLEVIGSEAASVCPRPEEILKDYDIVFAKGRAALESLAVGAAVVLCDARGVGPLVTTSEFDRLRPLNFGLRALRDPVNADVLERQIARYDAEDAAEVSRLVRASAGRDAIVDQIISLYRQVMAENEKMTGLDEGAEARAVSAYLRFLAPKSKTANASEHRFFQAESARVQLLAEVDRMRALLDEREQAERQLQIITNSFGRLLSRYGELKYRFLLPAYGRMGNLFRSKRRQARHHDVASSTTKSDHQKQTQSLQLSASDYELVVSFLRSHSGEEVEHVNGKVLPHLQGTFHLLQKWGNQVDVCLAGLCHAVYGTHDFHNSLVDISRRSELQALIGPEAEELVYFFASCDRSFSYPQIGGSAPIRFRDRFTGEIFVPDRALFSSFLELTFANELELASANRGQREHIRPSLQPLFERCQGLVSDNAYAFFVEIFGHPARQN
jgi:hypothetical protein